jgi:drug/metabolite transporter (DMT)-like permease
MKKQKIIGFLAGGLAASIMASLGFFVRQISVDAQIIAFARLGIGFLLLLSQIFFRKNLHDIEQTKISAPLVLSGVFLALTILAYTKAVNFTTLVNAVFLLYSAPIIAIILAAIWLKERLKLANFLLAVLAFLGLTFILDAQISLDRQNYLGNVWGILAATFYAFFIIFNRKIDPEIPASIRSFYQLLWGTIAILPFVFGTKINWAYPDLYWLIGIGFLHGYLALTLAIFAIQRLEVYEYGTISYLEPLTATLVGVLVYSETVSPWQAIGCFLIFGAGVGQVFLARNN